MKNLKYLLAVAFMGQASYGFAQFEGDALRFSQTQFGGTARTLGSGGANVAVGADLGSLSTNPAGLGMYQRSEFSFSPGIGLGNTEATGFGTTSSDARNSLHLGSLGVAFANRRPDDDTNPWRGGTFAIGLTRINDFNQSFRSKGQPPLNQDVIQRLGENNGDPLDDLAYEVFLTEDDAQGTYVPADFSKTGPLTQDEAVLTTGSQTQFDLGYGASYRDRLYIGGGIGIVSTSFNSTRTLSAVDPAAPAPGTEGTAFGSLAYREVSESRGGGINARIGAIYRPNDFLRIGAALQTPTFMTVTQTFSASMNAVFDQPIKVGNTTYTSASAATEAGDYDLSYVLTTPFKASGGVAAVIGKHGFVSADVEYLDYSQARLSNDNSDPASAGTEDFSDDNDYVQDKYQSAVNLRLGGELRFDIFRLRAGYARYGDAYKPNAFDRTRSYFTAGAGIRQKDFFLDVAGVYSTFKSYYSFYALDQNTPVTSINGSQYTTTVTAGWTF